MASNPAASNSPVASVGSSGHILPLGDSESSRVPVVSLQQVTVKTYRDSESSRVPVVSLQQVTVKTYRGKRPAMRSILKPPSLLEEFPKNLVYDEERKHKSGKYIENAPSTQDQFASCIVESSDRVQDIKNMGADELYNVVQKLEGEKLCAAELIATTLKSLAKLHSRVFAEVMTEAVRVVGLESCGKEESYSDIVNKVIELVEKVLPDEQEGVSAEARVDPETSAVEDPDDARMKLMYGYITRLINAVLSNSIINPPNYDELNLHRSSKPKVQSHRSNLTFPLSSDESSGGQTNSTVGSSADKSNSAYGSSEVQSHSTFGSSGDRAYSSGLHSSEESPVGRPHSSLTPADVYVNLEAGRACIAQFRTPEDHREYLLNAIAKVKYIGREIANMKIELEKRDDPENIPLCDSLTTENTWNN